MNSRSLTFMLTAIQALLLLTLVACQDTIPYRSTIGSQVTDPETQCPEGQEPKTEIGQDGQEVIVCKPKPIHRPNNAVFWKSDYCVCQDKKAISYGPTCTTFCSDKNTQGSQTLFATFNVSDTIGLGNLYAWCKTPLSGDPKEENPNCEMRAEDSSGNVHNMEVYLKPNANSLEVRNIQNYLQEDRAYILTVVETNSEAKSNTAQIIIYSDNGEGQGGPLRQSPITQYQCMRRLNEVSEANNDIYTMHAFPLHYYFVAGLPPSPIPAGTPAIFCHDIFNPAYGPVDSAFFPRLKERLGVFNLWDLTDPRFATGSDGRMVANASIIKKAATYGSTIPANSNFFQPFKWNTGPQFQSEGNNSTAEQPVLGYFMAPWINEQTNLSFCLNSTHYNGDVPLYRAIGEVVGTSTEGIYIAEKEPASMKGSDGNYYQEDKDFILIRETDLKAVWFEIVGGVPRKPTSENVANKAIYLFYPFNKATPYDRTMEQRMYRVKSTLELSNGTPNGTPIPHDKKMGCVPKF